MSEAPKKLGKYEIRRELGSGAMGVVYEAFDPGIERIVALKTIRRDQIDGAEAEDAIGRFQREARAAGRLNHPNIVAIYEFGEDQGTYFIAMEYVEGRELKSYFDKNERFEIREGARIMGQLLDALDYSHLNGVVHRDIKPANIIILPGGQVKVADFGIARIESSQYTQAGTVLGTPAYMSPEQFMGQVVDGRSDIFSAGVVLYQFLTGEKPFTGGATTIMHKVLNENPPPPSILSVQVPKLFDTVISTAMAKRPEDRFQLARQFKEAIQSAAEGKAVPGLDANSDATVVNTDSMATVQTMPTAPRALGGAAPASGSWQTVSSANGGGEAAASGGSVPPQTPAPPAGTAGAANGAAAVLKKPMSRRVKAVIAIAIALVVANFFNNHDKKDKEDDDEDAVATHVAKRVASRAADQAPALAPGTMLISAVGLANPADQKYQTDKALLTSDLRADSKSQLIEKALALYVDPKSLAKNYNLLHDKLMSNSSNYIASIVSESEPQMGKDGLMYVTTHATVKVHDLQKSLNQMAKDERVDFIRNNGDPKISVSITVSEEGANAPPQDSPVAENLFKERIKSFGFRTMSNTAQANVALGKDAAAAALDDIGMKKLSEKLAKSGIDLNKLAAGDPDLAAKLGNGADFAVIGDVHFKKLSAKLAASGLTIEKYLLTSWTVKCVDLANGEDIYYNNKIPVAAGSWASKEQALAGIGADIADEFSRDFFLQHFAATGQKVALKIDGLPDAAAQQAVLRELTGLQQVIDVSQRKDAAGGSATFDLQLAGSVGLPTDLVETAILKPLNAKLGQTCFSLGATAGQQVAVNFDKACSDPAILARLDANPPASLYAAPPVRQNFVLKDPAAVRKLSM
jgi:eukaryotic-like serine/threonine-protein kinase